MRPWRRHLPTVWANDSGSCCRNCLREANTTGSKANDAAILQDVIVIKEELERIREQVENLE